MRQSPSKNIFVMFVLIFFISIFILFGIMEFRHTKNILDEYQGSLQKVAINKTNLFLEELKAVSSNGARKIEEGSDRQTLEAISSYDDRIINVYLANQGGILDSASGIKENDFIEQLARQVLQQKTNQIWISDIYLDSLTHYYVTSLVVPLKDARGSLDRVLAISFRIDRYQKEMTQEFLDDHYEIAVFDRGNYPVLWPFPKETLAAFSNQQEDFYFNNTRYNITAAQIDQAPWKVYFFTKENNFETYRAITILVLVFALYACLYQLLVEFWGVNSSKTYFENIDFAIFNQINEGVILANNSGRIIFANEAAHILFADRKNNLRNVQLKEILGNYQADNKEKSSTITLRFKDKLLKAIHSPIIKKNRILGSLTVIRVFANEEGASFKVLDKLIDMLPQGILYVDKNHEISFVNLMAKCYLGNINKGTSIEVVDQELAGLIYNQIDSGEIKRSELPASGLACEIAPVYDDDGIYAGTLVVLLTSSFDGSQDGISRA
ncbi:PDC sensor domain-containing protein [Desulforamulus ruminis]|uniref:PAS domain-containing protein n=1 Tax=Desulforamulus ruminis (strain ATCC 23193 / DSM 2154 / NCIMB 8452 / DL) TaxID=696281 RepID=F6DVB9_DESRL|nr:PDC sensor domain-containing protein [Desulforamulus ruminis]AEG60272.1 hypothetical protein Desru_2018 [Desulforamulus ruminis DSM 2154]